MVSTSGTGGDQISDAGRFHGEGVGVDGVREEAIAEFSHFQETNSHNGGFGIVTPTQTVDPTGGDGNDVFQSTTQRDTGDVRHHSDVKVSSVEELFQEVVIDGTVFGGQRS